MQIEIWSDIACPWCYIGKRRFEAALAQFEHRDEVSVIWRSFELDPNAPASYGMSSNELLSRKYGVTAERAAQMNEHLTQVAALDQLQFRTDRMQPGNTFDAHRLTHFAATHGKRDEVTERLMKAYLEEGELMSDRTTLVRLAAEAGIDETKTRAMLESDAFADFVRSEEDRADDFGITGVPFFVIDERYAISGAQPAGAFVEALRTAWNNAHLEASVGEHCSGKSCSIHPH